MPRFDKTGPEGKGSKTGRGLGDCNEKKYKEKTENWMDRFVRRGLGRRLGIWHRGKN